MLRICSKKEYFQYRALAYRLALDKSKSGYPLYSDGVKTKQDFFKRAEMAFSRKHEEILLFEHEGIIEGWIHYYWLCEDKYLSTISFNISNNTENALSEFIDHLQLKFDGFTLYLGFSETNTVAIDFLRSQGFMLFDKAHNNVIFLSTWSISSKNNEDIVEIHSENYAMFRKLHDSQQDDMYWNADRIFDNLDDWVILVKLKNNLPVAAIYFQKDDEWSEIFGIDYKGGLYDATIQSELLIHALKKAKEFGIKYMTYFCNDLELPVVTNCGFTHIDNYVCYTKIMNAGCFNR